MEEEQLLTLIDKYLNEEASSEDLITLQSWYASLNEQPSLMEKLDEQEASATQHRILANINAALDAGDLINVNSSTNKATQI